MCVYVDVQVTDPKTDIFSCSVSMLKPSGCAHLNLSRISCKRMLFLSQRSYSHTYSNPCIWNLKPDPACKQKRKNSRYLVEEQDIALYARDIFNQVTSFLNPVHPDISYLVPVCPRCNLSLLPRDGFVHEMNRADNCL